MGFLRERMVAFPDLSAARLTREVRELSYAGAYTAVKRFLAAIRPENGPTPYEARFETPPGVQAQVDFARFVVDFADEPGTSRVVWLFSLVLGHSRFLFARHVLHQDLQTLLRCHIQAFEAICRALSITSTITGGCIQPSAISAPSSSRINTPAHGSIQQPETVRPQGRTPRS
jgi:hypothetical protein